MYSLGLISAVTRVRPALVKPMRSLFRLAVGKDVLEVFPAAERVQTLESRVASLERLLELTVGDPQLQWLYRNRMERMDATVELFPTARREFHLARYKFAARYAAEKSVADIACGTGYGTELLLREGGARSVVGVDIDAEAVEYASARHGDTAIQYLCASGDATGMPSESVDMVVSFETIEHVPCDRRLLEEFHRILRPGGTLVISTPNNWPLEIAPHHVRVYDRASYMTLLSERFEGVKLFNQNSGSDWQYNHGQMPGICPTTDGNYELAECFIAVCHKPEAR